MIKNLLTYRVGLPLKAIFCLAIFLALGTADVKAQFAISEDFRGSGNPDIIIGGPGGTEGTAYLTSGVNDPLNAGWLRLTNSSTFQKGYAYVNKQFPSTLGVLVDFEYKMWRNSTDSYDGADGIGVFLFNATSTFQLGGYGGSLGYAPNGAVTGLAGGYVGVGLDAYGNYSNPTEGRVGGYAERPNAVVLRGPTTSSATTTNRFLAGKTITTTNGTTFNYLDIATNTGTRTQNALDYNTVTTTRPTDAQFYRRVQIEITRLDAADIYYNVLVRWKTTPTGPFVYVTDYTTTDVPPALLKLGFAASTGGGINYHEIRNLLVTTPGNLRVVKRADKDILRTDTAANGTITYTIEVTNDTAFEIPNISFSDKITDSYGTLIAEGTSGFDITSITSTGFVTAALPTASSLATNEITGTLVLAANTTGYITITGRLYTLPDGSVLQNTATALPPLDEDLNNNTSIVRTPVTAENVDLILTKTVSEQCITSTAPTFTVYVSNNGASGTSFRRMGHLGTRVAFSVVVPPGYTYNDTTPGGLAGTESDAQNSNVTARWSRIAFANTPSTGYTTYRYVARGTDAGGAAQTLASGMTYPYPVTYTMAPPSGTTTYTDTNYALLFTDLNYGTPIETTANQVNNDASIVMYVKPAAPTVPPGTLYYCVDEDAPVLTATATGSNTLRWYMTSNGFSSEFPIKPYTGIADNYTYYVSQVNGDCEGPKTPITVTVGPADTGSISIPAINCPGSTVITGTAISNASYRWERSSDGINSTIISGATGQSYTATNLTETTYFRRLTTVTANGKTCEGPTNWVRIYLPNAGVIATSQSACEVGSFNPNAFTSVQAGDVGTVNGITYTYRWQISNNGTSGWTDISGATNDTYDSPSINATRFFRRVVRYTSGGTTCEAPSNVLAAYIGEDEWYFYAGSIGAAQTICYNSVPATLTSSGTWGDGLGTGFYQWESSTTSSSSGFTTIPDASPTSGSYSPGALTQTTWFRRRRSNGCNSGYTGAIQITVLNPVTGSISGTQTICYNTVPATITSSQTGTTGYRWEYAEGTTGGTWTAVSPAVTSATLTPPALTNSRRYRRYTVSGSCESVATNIITITVKAQTNAGTISSSQNICNGGSVAPLTGTTASGDGTITYLWQSSNDGVNNWNPAGGTNNQQNYTPSTTTTTYYRRVATVSGCTTQNYSNIVSIIFSVVPQAGGIQGNQNICNGSTPPMITSSSAGTGTGTITYAWQFSTDNGATWSTDISGATAETYQPGALTQTTQFRRFTIATNGTAICRSTSSAGPVTITVSAVPGVGSIGPDQTICNGGTPAQIGSTANGTGTGGVSYAWQSSTDNGANWSADIVNAQNSTYQPPALTTTTLYRRFTITNNGSTAICRSATATTPVTITVLAVPAPGAIGSDQNICNGGTPAPLTSTTAGTGTGTITYAWQSSTDNINWSGDISGQSGPTFTPPALTQTTYYKRFTIATSGTTSCRSASATTPVVINVMPVPGPGNIANNQNICSGNAPALLTSSSAGTGTGTITYAWQFSTDNGASWSGDISGASGDTYQPGTLTQTTLFRRITIATNGTAVCRSTSVAGPVTITVSSTAGAGAIASNQNICSGSTPALLTSATAGTGTGTITYAWQFSTNGGSSWSADISGASGATYQPGALTQTTLYQRFTIATNGAAVCRSAATASITVTVSSPTQGALTANQSICMDTVPALIGPGTAGTGAGTLTYRWESSVNGTSGWTTIAGATSASYQPPLLHATRYYRRITISTSTVSGNTAVCESPATAAVMVATRNCKVITNPMIRSRVN